MAYLRGLSSSAPATLINDVPPTAAQKVAWYNVLGQWKQAVGDFETNLAAVKSQSATAASIKSSNPTLYAAYTSALASAPTVQARIGELSGAITDAENWLKGAWQDVTGAWTYVKTNVTALFGLRGMAGLGQWQIVPVAVIVGAVAYVGSEAMHLYNVHTKLALVQSYVAKGYTPAAASALVAKLSPSSPSLFSSLSSTMKYGAISIAGIGALYLFMTLRKKR